MKTKLLFLIVLAFALSNGVWGQPFAIDAGNHTPPSGDIYHNSGKVGIGTSSPTVLLDIELPAGGTQGDPAIHIHNNTTNTTASYDPRINFINQGTTEYTLGYDVDDDKLKFGTTATSTGTSVTIENDGDVGVGTTTPSGQLYVVDDQTNTTTHFYFDASSSSGASNDGDVFVIDHGRGDGMPGNLFKVLNGTSTKLIVEGGGDVGIATTNATRKLDCDGDALFNKSNGNNDFTIEGQTDPNLFFVDASTNFVGVGTNAPTEKFHIDGDANAQEGFLLDLQSSATNFSSLMIYSDPDNDQNGDDKDGWVAFRPTRGNGIVFLSETNPDNTILSIDESENKVGIGTLVPSEALHVVGKARVTQYNTSTNNDIYKDANGVLSVSSDRAFKKDIEPMERVLGKVMELKPRTYNWKNGPNPRKGHKDFGFIAQEMEQVFPEVVPILDKEGHRGVNYSRFAVILTKALQEQQAIIEEEKVQKEELGKEVQALKKEMQELKEMMASNQALNTSSVTLSNPQGVILNQNDPNPFRERTTITYTVPEDVASASIIIYDVNGRLIKEIGIERGMGQLEVFASDLSTGTYTYSIIADGTVVDSKKMVVSK